MRKILEQKLQKRLIKSNRKGAVVIMHERMTIKTANIFPNLGIIATYMMFLKLVIYIMIS